MTLKRSSSWPERLQARVLQCQSALRLRPVAGAPEAPDWWLASANPSIVARETRSDGESRKPIARLGCTIDVIAGQLAVHGSVFSGLNRNSSFDDKPELSMP